VIREAARELAMERSSREIPPRRIISKLRVLVESSAVCSAAVHEKAHGSSDLPFFRGFAARISNV